jgi:hypothetical protein
MREYAMRESSIPLRAHPRQKLAAMLLAGLTCLGAAGAAQAQTRPALVRSVDEPARVPYGGTVTPTCPFGNQCVAEFPVVPAGKRLRVTAIAAVVRSNTSTVPHLLALHRNDSFGANIISMVTMPPFGAAYYGSVASTSQAVDVMIEAGDKPVLEVGLAAGAGGITGGSTRLTLTGYLVDVAP